MKKYLVIYIALVLSSIAALTSFAEDNKEAVNKVSVSQHLQDISVTIRADRSEGSGVITNVNGVNYVWTAGHVVESLRHTHAELVEGSPKTVVEFNDAEIVKELVEDGRTVGQMRFFAEVIRYSNATFGDDLALLKVRKKDLAPSKVKFYLDKEIPSIGTELYHVGSLLGQMGANSMTRGIMSQHGRLIAGIVYDQTTCAAFPGSSGGGIFLNDGRYIGMIVRGAGETFNLCVPIRRMHQYAKKVGVEFIIDPSVKVPTNDELRKFPVEDVLSYESKRDAKEAKSFPRLIKSLDVQEQE